MGRLRTSLLTVALLLSYAEVGETQGVTEDDFFSGSGTGPLVELEVDISVSAVTPTSITITWNLTAEDEGSVRGFHLSHHAVGIPLLGSNVLGQFELLPLTREWTISPLEEGLRYNITFDVVLRGQFDGPSIVQRSTFLVSTPETVPGAPPTNIQLVGTLTSSTTVTIQVSPPPVLDRNGIIVSYRVSYRKEGAGIDDVMTMEFLSTGEDPQRLTLTGLDPGSAYMYSVRAATVVGAGTESVNRSFTTADEAQSVVNINITFLQQEYRVTESERNVSVSITVGIDPLATTPINLTIATIDVNTTYRALALKDYSSIQYSVSISPNEVRELQFTFYIHDDDIAEPCEETFSIRVFSTSPFVRIPHQSCVPVVILDDDDPVVHFIGGPLTASELDVELEVAVSVEKVEGIPLNLTFVFEPAEEQDSPLQLTGLVHLIPSPGRYNFSIPIVNNFVYEGPRSGNLTALYSALRPCPSRSLETSTAVVVMDDDTVHFVFTQARYTFTESDGRVEVTLMKVGETTLLVTATLTVVEGSAEEDKDFVLLTPEVNFLPHEEEKPVVILILDDSVFEGDEVFTLLVFHDQPPVMGASQPTELTPEEGSTQVIIRNDDSVVVEFEEELYIAPSSDIYVNVSLVLLGNTSTPATVRVLGDYVGADGFPVLNFTVEVDPLGPTQVPVFVGADGVYNQDAKWVLRLEPLDSVVVIGPRSQTEIRVHETDTLQATFTARSFSAVEGNGTATVSVQLLGRTAVPVTVRVTPFGLNTTTAATEDVDFSTSPVEVTLPSGRGDTTTASVTLTLLDDEVLERPEMFGVVLTSDLPAVTVEPISIARVDIVDDDTVTVGFTVGNVTVVENVGQVNVCLVVTGQREIPVVVRVTTPTTAEVTATGGLDFSTLSSTLSLAVGADVRCVEVAVLEDRLEEAAEVFVVQVESQSPAGTVVIGQGTVRVVVMDNDEPVVPLHYFTCAVTAQQVTPFSPSPSPGEPYLLDSRSARCEHVIFTSSSDGHVFEILADLMQGTLFGFRQAGIRLDDLLVLLDENGQIENIDDLGTPIAQSGSETEYPGGTFYAETDSGFSLRFSEVKVRVRIVERSLVVEVANDSSLVGGARGLCGNLNGALTTPEGLVFVTTNEEFVRSWRVLTFSLPTRAECRRNATVTGDPVFSVPISMTEKLMDQVDRRQVSLCFELRGRPNVTLNLISDQCISVSTHYHGSSYFTFMDKISILAPGRDGQCRQVTVDVNGCQVTVDGEEVSMYRKSGVVLRKLRNRVYVSVPNCHELPTAMWVTCTEEEGEDLLHFRVARGGSLAPTAHGIIGQFWNVPVTVESLNRTRDGPLFLVNVAYPDAPVRRFVAELIDYNWVGDTGVSCLYAGNSNAGPTAEYQEHNDGVIMGDYLDYLVQSMFDPVYTYSQFQSSCALEQT